MIDTEIYSPAGSKLAQWFGDVTLGSSPVTRSYSWSTAGLAAGTYRVAQGLFTPNWATNVNWNAKATSVTLIGASSPSGSSDDGAVPTPTPAPTGAGSSSNPLSASQFYIDPANPAAAQANAWQSTRPADAALMNRIAQGGAAVWLGNWNGDVQADTRNVVSNAASANQVPVLVAYNIPGRDCGQYSAGGASGGDAYRSWIRSVASGIGSNRAIVVLEPDALAQIDCLSSSLQSDRLALLADAVSVLSAHSGVSVYLDAGHSGWVDASTMATRLRSAGVAGARGFSLNVSNFMTTADNVAYGEQLSSLLGGSHYIIDTSRNGNGSNGQWCNPSGRALGVVPTTNTGTAHGDAFLWVKRPGESDGSCNGGPGAGQWWPEYALGLAKAAWG